MRRMNQNREYGLFIAVVAAVLLWLLHKKGYLHEAVSAAILFPSQPGTGFPQYDTRNASTVPENEAFAIKPIDSLGKVTEHPGDPSKITCPVGYKQWHNVADDSYWCLPEA